MNKINSLIAEYPQFKSTSKLYSSISHTLGCSMVKAKKLARTHCNLVSFWAILYSSGEYINTYSNFFKIMLNEGFCKKNGYILVDKAIILDKLLIDSTLDTSRDFDIILNTEDLNPNKYYQIKIKANTSGWHFFDCYLEDGKFYGSDTSYRGTPFLLTDKVNENNFEKITEVC